MIDTVRLRVPTPLNKHLFQLGSSIEKVAKLKQQVHDAGVVVMEIAEYKNPDGSQIDCYKFDIIRPNGYVIRIFGNEFYLTLEYSVTKFYFGTSYVFEDDDRLFWKSINALKLVNWTLSRIDMCQNYYFNSMRECDDYVNILHASHNKNFTRAYNTGFAEWTKSSYHVVYQKHKDPKDIGIDIPILRFELKITMRNTYKLRSKFGLTEINKDNVHLFFNLGKNRLTKIIDKYECTKLPENYISKNAPRISKNMFLILNLYKSFENAYHLGVISRDTLRRYRNHGYNTLSKIPDYHKKIPFKWKLKLDNYLKINRRIAIN